MSTKGEAIAFTFQRVELGIDDECDPIIKGGLEPI